MHGRPSDHPRERHQQTRHVLQIPESFDERGLAPFYAYAGQELAAYMEDGRIVHIGRVSYVFDYVYLSHLVAHCAGDLLGTFNKASRATYDAEPASDDDVGMETDASSSGGEASSEEAFHERLMLRDRGAFPRSVDARTFDAFVWDICGRFHKVRTSMSTSQYVNFLLESGRYSRAFSGCQIDVGLWAMIHGTKALGSVLYVLNDNNHWRTYSKCDCICVALLTCLLEQEVLGVGSPPLCGVEHDARPRSGLHKLLHKLRSHTGQAVFGHHVDTSPPSRKRHDDRFCQILWNIPRARDQASRISGNAYLYVHAFLLLRLWYKVYQGVTYFQPCGSALQSQALGKAALDIYKRVRSIALDVCGRGKKDSRMIL